MNPGMFFEFRTKFTVLGPSGLGDGNTPAQEFSESQKSIPDDTVETCDGSYKEEKPKKA